jgi:hypothetical protein
MPKRHVEKCRRASPHRDMNNTWCLAQASQWHRISNRDATISQHRLPLSGRYCSGAQVSRWHSQPIKLDQFAPRVALGEASTHDATWEIAGNLRRYDERKAIIEA